MLWGNNDSKAANGTIAIAANGLVTGTSTVFSTIAREGDFIRVSGEDYRITSITNATSCQVVAAVQGATLTAVGAGNTYTFSEKPKFVSTSECAAGSLGDATLVFGVDTTEVGVTSGIPHAGWVRRIEGSGGRAGRVTYEVLVAGSSIAGDQADDTEFPDS